MVTLQRIQLKYDVAMDILFFIAVIIWVVGGGLMKSSRSANSSFRKGLRR